MGHRRFLSKKHLYLAMDCQFNGEKENREALLHVTRDLVHLKVKDIKTIEELPKLTEKTLDKRKNEMVKKKMECGTRNQFYGS
jgi:predicted type IV restriction endonuclease